MIGCNNWKEYKDKCAYNEITDFIKIYSTNEDEFKLYFDLYSSGISLMSNISRTLYEKDYRRH